MPSRRPPSQRDPAYALHRLPAAVKQVLPGTTVRNSTPVPKRQLTKIAAAASGDSEHNGAGVASTAVGTGAVASGLRSTSLGDGATASAQSSTALGRLAVATAQEATAVGQNSTASGIDSTAIGHVSEAHYGGTALGYGSFAEGDLSVSVGGASYSPGANGIAVGFGARAWDIDSVALGSQSGANTSSVAVGASASTSTGAAVCVGDSSSAWDHGVALGQGAAAHDYCMSLGPSATSTALRGIAIGYTASNSTADRCTLKANELQLDQSNGTGQTSLILRDSSNVRWRLTVSTGGALVIALA